MQLKFRTVVETNILDTIMNDPVTGGTEMKKNTYLSKVKNNPDVVFIEYC